MPQQEEMPESRQGKRKAWAMNFDIKAPEDMDDEQENSKEESKESPEKLAPPEKKGVLLEFDDEQG